MELWALGDYDRIARLIAGMGRDLVAAAGVEPGHRVLDVAAGTGNATIPAAEVGAKVTALDATPELLDVGRRVAGDLPIEWVEGDATDLPFADESFDVVLSCIGAMFAADHAAAARELTRVCRPGGTVALANWTPGGSLGRFFALVGRHAGAPPTGAPPPVSWGDPTYVRRLFPDLSVETDVRMVEVDFTGTAEELAALYQEAFGPVVAARSKLDARARAAFDRELVEFYVAENEAEPGQPGRWRYDWLLVLARRP